MATRISIRDTDALQVAGYNETMRGLRRVSVESANEVRKLIREETKRVALEARNTPSGSASEPTRATWITWRANNKGAGVLMRASTEPRAYATEFGMEEWHIPVGRGRRAKGTVQSAMRNRTFGKWGGDGDVLDGDSGRKIQPTIRRRMPRFVNDLADRLGDWIVDQFYGGP
jgi:hypothetical protein